MREHSGPWGREMFGDVGRGQWQKPLWASVSPDSLTSRTISVSQNQLCLNRVNTVFLFDIEQSAPVLVLSLLAACGCAVRYVRINRPIHATAATTCKRLRSRLRLRASLHNRRCRSQRAFPYTAGPGAAMVNEVNAL